MVEVISVIEIHQQGVSHVTLAVLQLMLSITLSVSAMLRASVKLQIQTMSKNVQVDKIIVFQR